MRLTVTTIAVLLGLMLCAFNYTGYDPHNMFFFMFSVPAWIVPLFTDIHNVSVLLMYALTIITWGLLGFFADAMIAKQRKERSTGDHAN